jgi:dipeptidase E
MSIIVAIGGGELKDLETLEIDRAIVRLSSKRRPKVLFIPTASNDSIGYWETFQKLYVEELGCETDVLFLIGKSLSDRQIEEKILSADIIYVGGGNTQRMLQIWKKFDVDTLLRQAYNKGIILAGLSAGAIAWFRYGSSDSRRFASNGSHKDVLMRISALGFIPCLVSPHHIRDKKLRDQGLEDIMNRTSGIALAIDDNASVFFHDNQYRVVLSHSDSKVKKVFRKNGKIEWKTVEDSGTLKDLLAKE